MRFGLSAVELARVKPLRVLLRGGGQRPEVVRSWFLVLVVGRRLRQLNVLGGSLPRAAAVPWAADFLPPSGRWNGQAGEGRRERGSGWKLLKQFAEVRMLRPPR